GITLECGQHDDPAAPDVAYRAIVQTLALLGLADLPLSPPATAFDCLALADVVDRHHADDRFARTWSSFDRLAEGELIAVRADGTEVRAPRAGAIVFPDVSAKPGHEWFYLAQVSQRAL
ncbi:MAG: succinylglutamate desuccinylase, partial [Rubrivivax sp.]